MVGVDYGLSISIALTVSEHEVRKVVALRCTFEQPHARGGALLVYLTTRRYQYLASSMSPKKFSKHSVIICVCES